MDLILKSRNGRISDRQREHIHNKLNKLTRYLDPIMSMEVEVSTEQRQNQGETHRMQATLVGEHGIILRADQTAGDLYTATDMVQEVLQRQIKRYKEKHWRRGRIRRKGGEFVPAELSMPQSPAMVEAAETAVEEPAEEWRIQRVKEFTVRPMYSDEAIEQMELLDHSFYVFRDADTSRISIVYRRRDENYGMIVLQDE